MTDITTLEQLAELYREPTDLVKAKKTDRLDAVTRQVLAASPFFLLATADADGNCDVSPRGGPPGQLSVLDEHRVAFPDLNGNNLVDSFRNLIANPRVGLLVLTPGTDETVRIDGRAQLSIDPDLLDRWEGLLRRPKMAVVVEVEHAFIHCAKAFRRGEVWEPSSWGRFRDLPDPIEMLIEHTDGRAIPAGSDPVVVRGRMEGVYAEQLDLDRPEG